MTHKVSFIGYAHHRKNAIFDFSEHNPVNRDDGVYPFYLLRETLKASGVELNTSDLIPPEESDLALFFDDLTPEKVKLARGLKCPCFLILTESPIARKEIWATETHDPFKRVFTWNDTYIDDRKYFKICYSNFAKSTLPSLEGRERFCCLIAGAKKSRHPQELYSARRSAIDWFERNQPESLDLFGPGWDISDFAQTRFMHPFVSRIQPLQKALNRKSIVYKGLVSNKHKALQRYKYSICFENAQGFPGYITEKIFDCLYAGCVPIYWGAPNIEDYLPTSAFIDMRKYDSYGDLFSFLERVSDEEWIEYARNGYEYLSTEKAQLFTGEHFAQVISKGILDALELELR